MSGKAIMFCGKGGVGKTTCAASTAVKMACGGRNTLALSTDPTPSLGHIFRLGRCRELTQVADRLFVQEIGMDQVRKMWDARFGREVYEVFSAFVDIGYADFVEFISSVLPGMMEEFMVDYIRGLKASNTYEAIIWDTAPLGQTLELLRMPSLLLAHLKGAPRVYSRLVSGQLSKKSILEIIRGWEEVSRRDTAFLKEQVEFVLVTEAETLAVEQLDDILGEMARYGLEVRSMLVNNLVPEQAACLFPHKREDQAAMMRALRGKYADRDIQELPMLPQEITGMESLKKFGGHINI